MLAHVCGNAAIPFFHIERSLASLTIVAKMVVPRIPNRSAPFTFFTTSVEVTTKPMKNTRTFQFDNGPIVTGVASGIGFRMAKHRMASMWK